MGDERCDWKWTPPSSADGDQTFRPTFFEASIGGGPWSGRSRLETFRRSFVTNTGDSVLNEVVRRRRFGESFCWRLAIRFGE